MGYSRKYGVARSVFKVAKLAARLSQDLGNIAEEASSDEQTPRRESFRQPTRSMIQDNEAFEQTFLQCYKGKIGRKIYVKLVGVSHANADGSSRQTVIRKLAEGQTLILKREPHNAYDPNAILVCAANGSGAGHLDARLAGDVTRSMDKGYLWICHFKKLIQAPGTRTSGAVICLIKLYKHAKLPLENTTLCDRARLAKHYINAKPVVSNQNPPLTKIQERATAVLLLFIGGCLILFAIHGCMS